MEQKLRWYTEKTFVNIDTGEVLKKSEYEGGYYRTILKEQEKIIKTDKSGNKYGITKITWGVREHEQHRLF